MLLKKLFSKKEHVENIDFPEMDIALQLMFEIAMSDGYLDKKELQLLKNRVREIAPQEIAVSTVLKKMIDQSLESISLYPTIKKINDTYDKEKKKDLLRTLWKLVIVDNKIDPYEESLYFQIADLIYIKRARANQIKHENS
jgi:uncharacterized tellurite resistance protein B-like protein